MHIHTCIHTCKNKYKCKYIYIYVCVCTVLDVDIKLKGSIHPILMVVYHFQLDTNPGERDAMTNGLEQDQNDTGSFGDQTQTAGHSKNFTAISTDMSFEISYLIKNIFWMFDQRTEIYIYMCVCVATT